MNALLVASLIALGGVFVVPTLDLPPRASTSPGGEAFARAIAGLPLREREERILAEVRAGNVPRSLLTLVPVTITGTRVTVTYHVTPDYLTVGSEEDSLLVPLTPSTAQRIADLVDCVLPTSKMVDDVYRNASLKLTPSPIAPSPEMTTVPVFLEHNRTVRKQRGTRLPGALVAGHKKDVVIANRAFRSSGKVAIYGWHRGDGTPIQPLYTGHSSSWVDYSHGIRLVHRRVTVNGEETSIEKVLADPALAPLMSDEGVMSRLRYDTGAERSAQGSSTIPAPPDEEIEVLRLDPGVRIAIDRPKEVANRPVLLIFYALPNGNSIEQTIGRAVRPGDDWHFDIQHIGAQTRFLRGVIRDRAVVVAYLENDLKSWPAWRKKNGDAGIPQIVDAVRSRFKGRRTRVVLAGHSGGGSLIFGYLNCAAVVPDEVERIAFLDSNYAYETSRHRDKLATWLKSSDSHALCVLAYNDAVALLNGKPFVSADGGTWGRSHLMLRDLENEFEFTTVRSNDLRKSTALKGRITFWFRENPEKAILHTVQVERNGFIESLLSGTTHAGAGYEYFGGRAYTRFILSE